MVDTERMIEAQVPAEPAATTHERRPDPVRPRVGLVQHRSRDSQDLDPFFALLVAGMEESLDAAGGVVLVVFEQEGERELEVYARWAREGLVDTVVLTDLSEADPRVDHCRGLGLQVVVLGPEAVEGVSCVIVDETSAVRSAVEHLSGLGHRRVARVQGPLRLRHTVVRSGRFDAELAAAGMTWVVAQGDYSIRSGETATAALMALDAPPTAIVYDNDLMALGGLRSLAEHGSSTPADVSLLAWDDSPHCRLARPALSAVTRDLRDLGATVGSLAVSAAAGDHARIVHVGDVSVVGRGTSGPPPRPVDGARQTG